MVIKLPKGEDMKIEKNFFNELTKRGFDFSDKQGGFITGYSPKLSLYKRRYGYELYCKSLGDTRLLNANLFIETLKNIEDEVSYEISGKN
jgi:hypothetical protein